MYKMFLDKFIKLKKKKVSIFFLSECEFCKDFDDVRRAF